MEGFSITPEGVISHNGEEVGTISLDVDRGKRKEFRVRGLWIEDQGGHMVRYSSIGAAGSVTRIEADHV